MTRDQIRISELVFGLNSNCPPKSPQRKPIIPDNDLKDKEEMMTVNKFCSQFKILDVIIFQLSNQVHKSQTPLLDVIRFYNFIQERRRDHKTENYHIIVSQLDRGIPVATRITTHDGRHPPFFPPEIKSIPQ